MYFDNLTLVSLIVFTAALGSFIKGCLMNGCITNTVNQVETSKKARVTMPGITGMSGRTA